MEGVKKWVWGEEVCGDVCMGVCWEVCIGW